MELREPESLFRPMRLSEPERPFSLMGLRELERLFSPMGPWRPESPFHPMRLWEPERPFSLMGLRELERLFSFLNSRESCSRRWTPRSHFYDNRTLRPHGFLCRYEDDHQGVRVACNSGVRPIRTGRTSVPCRRCPSRRASHPVPRRSRHVPIVPFLDWTHKVRRSPFQ